MTLLKKTLPCGRELKSSELKLSAKKLLELEKKLKDFLAQKGQKFTQPRWNLARTILETSGHLDAQKLIQKVKSKHPGIGAATVYRNIKVLCEAGILIESHQSREGRVLYELTDEEHHDHIICLDCGEILEFQENRIERLQVEVAEKNQFKLTDHRLVIHGRCELLKNKIRKASTYSASKK